MKFLYVCDIHGDENKYNEILKTAKRNRIKYIVLGGDILPKRGGPREEIQPAFIDGFLSNFLNELKNSNIELIFIMGNDDLEIFDDKIEKICREFNNIHNIDRKEFKIEDCSFIGLSNVLDNPFRYKNRVVIEEGLEMEPQRSERIWINKGKDVITVEEWKEYRKTKLEKMENILKELPTMDNSKKTIFVFHDPPYGVGLDECAIGHKAGSKAILEFIKDSGAYMSLHGHIHESPSISGKWYTKVGNTICIQPGQTELGEEKMMWMIIDTDRDKQERYIKSIK